MAQQEEVPIRQAGHLELLVEPESEPAADTAVAEEAAQLVEELLQLPSGQAASDLLAPAVVQRQQLLQTAVGLADPDTRPEADQGEVQMVALQLEDPGTRLLLPGEDSELVEETVDPGVEAVAAPDTEVGEQPGIPAGVAQATGSRSSLQELLAVIALH